MDLFFFCKCMVPYVFYTCGVNNSSIHVDNLFMDCYIGLVKSPGAIKYLTNF